MTDGDAAKVKAHAAVCLSACKPNIPLGRYQCQQLKAAASYPSPPSSPSISSSYTSSSIPSTCSSTCSHSPSPSPPLQYQLMHGIIQGIAVRPGQLF